MWGEATCTDPICIYILYILRYKTPSQKQQTKAGNSTQYDKHFKISRTLTRSAISEIKF